MNTFIFYIYNNKCIQSSNHTRKVIIHLLILLGLVAPFLGYGDLLEFLVLVVAGPGGRVRPMVILVPSLCTGWVLVLALVLVVPSKSLVLLVALLLLLLLLLPGAGTAAAAAAAAAGSSSGVGTAGTGLASVVVVLASDAGAPNLVLLLLLLVVVVVVVVLVQIGPRCFGVPAPWLLLPVAPASR